MKGKIREQKVPKAEQEVFVDRLFRLTNRHLTRGQLNDWNNERRAFASVYRQATVDGKKAGGTSVSPYDIRGTSMVATVDYLEIEPGYEQRGDEIATTVLSQGIWMFAQQCQRYGYVMDGLCFDTESEESAAFYDRLMESLGATVRVIGRNRVPHRNGIVRTTYDIEINLG